MPSMINMTFLQRRCIREIIFKIVWIKYYSACGGNNLKFPSKSWGCTIHGCYLTVVNQPDIPCSNTLSSDCKKWFIYECHESNTDIEGYIVKLCLHSFDYAADHKRTVSVLWGKVIIRNVRQDCQRCNYGCAQRWALQHCLEGQASQSCQNSV